MLFTVELSLFFQLEVYSEKQAKKRAFFERMEEEHQELMERLREETRKEKMEQRIEARRRESEMDKRLMNMEMGLRKLLEMQRRRRSFAIKDNIMNGNSSAANTDMQGRTGNF